MPCWVWISFLTAGPDEAVPGPSKSGTKAPQAAVCKFTLDFERGFIRAEVIAYHDLQGSGTLAAAPKPRVCLFRRHGVRHGDVVNSVQRLTSIRCAPKQFRCSGAFC